MKYADISEEEFAKLKLNKGDLLFNRTNSIEWVGKTGVFELEGDYCFASYLIRVVINREIALPQYVNLMMNSSDFQRKAKANASKAINQANINATKIKALSIPVPSLIEQQALVDEIEILEEKICQEQLVLDKFKERKQEVLKRYL